MSEPSLQQPTWKRNLPNQLTMMRLVFAAAFFICLNQYRYDGPFDGPGAVENLDRHTGWLWVAFSLFIIGALTDIADGFLARRWKVESTFGRIMDPVCDKVLVIGAFIYLAGPRFHVPDTIEIEAADTAFFGLISLKTNQISGVFPWMVAVILSRELLVTSMRSTLESSGVKFGANVFGKLKMFLQSATAPTVMGLVWLDPIVRPSIVYVRDGFVWATVIVTILSGLPYLLAAHKIMGQEKKALK